MTESTNEWRFSGNVGADAELRYLASGRAVVNFNVAIEEHVPQGDDTLKIVTRWVRVAVWGRLAEAAVDAVRKGAKVEIVGRPESSAWKDPSTGEVKHRLEAVAKAISVNGTRLTTGPRAKPERTVAPGGDPRWEGTAAPWVPPGEEAPDDLPFE